MSVRLIQHPCMRQTKRPSTTPTICRSDKSTNNLLKQRAICCPCDRQLDALSCVWLAAGVECGRALKRLACAVQSQPGTRGLWRVLHVWKRLRRVTTRCWCAVLEATRNPPSAGSRTTHWSTWPTPGSPFFLQATIICAVIRLSNPDSFPIHSESRFRFTWRIERSFSGNLKHITSQGKWILRPIHLWLYVCVLW